MIEALAFFVSCILLVLAGIHFYWAFGGAWGFDATLPTDAHGKRMLNPKKTDSLIVGLGLLIFGAYYLMITCILTHTIPNWLYVLLGWLIPIIFFARAIGDFRYIGFFKKIKTTRFAKYDTWYYSPLCLILSIATTLITTR